MYFESTKSKQGVHSTRLLPRGIYRVTLKPEALNTLSIMATTTTTSGGYDPMGDLTTLMKIVAVILIGLSGFNVLVDVAACVDLHKQYTNYDSNGMNTSVICAMILVTNHMVISTVHFYYAIKLLKVVDERNFLKFHQWYQKLLPFMCVECVVVFLFLFFQNNVLYFIIFGNMGVTFKLYMLWPIKRFMKHLRTNVTIPPGTLWTN